MIEQKIISVDKDNKGEANVTRTSLVNNPATQKVFAIFSEEKADTKLDTSFNIILPTPENNQKIDRNPEGFQRIISGVWFMPDTDYLRKDENGEVFTTRISKDELNQAVLNYTKNGYQDNFDMNHNGVEIKGLKTIEIWQMYEKYQYSPILLNSIWDLGYEWEDVPLGTVFMTVYIEDEEFFNNEILTGNVKGFSIEGLFKILDYQEEDMDKNSELFSALGLEQNKGIIKTNQGKLSIDSKEIKLEEAKVAKGEFSTDNGFKIVVQGGKIVDFGFENEAPSTPVAEAPTETQETPVETQETPVETSVETPETQETPVETSVETPETQETPVETEETSTETEEKSELEALKEELAKAKAELEKQKKATPIKKTVGSTNVPQDLENYLVRKAGNQTYYIPKR
jgi:hypothetical protein